MTSPHFPDLVEYLATALEADPLGDAFPGWASRLFRFQFEGIPAYRRYCERLGIVPDDSPDWSGIPAVATSLFRTHDLCAFPAGEATRTFRTSGTTAGARGRHLLRTLAYYEASLVPPFVRHVLHDGAAPRWISLVPDAADLPDSSLSHMVSALMAGLGAPGSAGCADGGRLDVGAAWRHLAAARADGVPVLVFGTALAWMDLLDHPPPAGVPPRLPLPPGSRAVETGGFKGRRREASRGELHRALERRLGLGRDAVFSEYGMTELGSQLYSRGGGPFHPPPWLRVLAIDPGTGRPAGAGAPGLLRFVDLANAESVLAVQTEDLGRVDAGGGVTLLGRAPGAPPRGCSLTAEEMA